MAHKTTKSEEMGELEGGEKEEKKKKRRDSVEKRKNLKKKDKQARWSGLIMLVIILMLGFFLWISGEIGRNESPYAEPVKTNTNLENQGSRVIFE